MSCAQWLGVTFRRAIPESPRWLFTVREINQARHAIFTAATKNGVDLLEVKEKLDYAAKHTFQVMRGAVEVRTFGLKRVIP